MKTTQEFTYLIDAYVRQWTGPPLFRIVSGDVNILLANSGAFRRSGILTH